MEGGGAMDMKRDLGRGLRRVGVRVGINYILKPNR